MVRIKRVYEPPSPTDGERVLVDRLWPRGLSKRAAAVDAWMKEVAPSHALRKWFHHHPERWAEFRRRYLAELRRHRDELTVLRRKATRGTMTLLFGSRDVEHNNAVVLKSLLERRASSRTPRRRAA
jgi:uncharacterized protein YeaO (DUF488 family)